MADVVGTDRNDLITVAAVSAGVTGQPLDNESNTITGALGNDRLEGGNGDDFIFGELLDTTGVLKYGADRISGGDGDDAISGDSFALTAGAKGGKDVIDGGDGNDSLYGDAGETMTGATGGADAIYGGDGDDVIYGDAVTMDGGRGGADKLFGGNGNDILWGDAESLGNGAIGGNDTIDGGAGDDLINGNGGRDKLTGGDGADTFYFNLGSGRDQILDFDTTEGDVLNLSTLFDSTTTNFASIDTNADGFLGAGDTGVTVKGSNMTIDLGVMFGTASAKVDSIVMKGVTSIGEANISDVL